MSDKVKDLGMEPDEMPIYNRITYNLVAKVIREEFPGHSFDNESVQAERTTLSVLALKFALRFKRDNPSFDAPEWLDKCSADPELWPLSELWEDGTE